MGARVQNGPGPGQCKDFATTHWSLVLRAGRAEDAAAKAALAELCQCYWYPLYAFVRRRITNVHEAQDLTQAFFAFFLESEGLARAAPERGSFRGFLLATFKNFLANQWDRGRAHKRGGNVQHFSLDLETGESRFSREQKHEETPERVFERQWALTLLEHVMVRLQAVWKTAGKNRQFELLKGAITGAPAGYAAAARELGMTGAAARQAVHRMRKRYRELLREEVGRTVESEEEVDDEIRALFKALGN